MGSRPEGPLRELRVLKGFWPRLNLFRRASRPERPRSGNCDFSVNGDNAPHNAPLIATGKTAQGIAPDEGREAPGRRGGMEDDGRDLEDRSERDPNSARPDLPRRFGEGSEDPEELGHVFLDRQPDLPEVGPAIVVDEPIAHSDDL